MASGSSKSARHAYPKEWLAVEAQLREAAPLVQALLSGVPHARVRAAVALGQVADACRRASDEAAALRAKRPASPTAPSGGASGGAKLPRTAAPLAEDPARARFEAELTSFYDSDAGRAAVAAVEGASREWRNPQINHVVFALHTLYERVRAEGGYDAVSRNKQWRRIAETFGTLTDANVGSKVKAAYAKYLLAYENGARAPARQGSAAARDASPGPSPRRAAPSPRVAAASAAMARAAGAGGGLPVPQPSPLRPAQPTAGKAPLPLTARPKPAAARQGTLFGAFGSGAAKAAHVPVRCSNPACGIKITLMAGNTRFTCTTCDTQQDIAMEID